MKEWLIAWSTGPGQVKHVQCVTQEAAMQRWVAINAAKRVKQSDGTFKTVWPDIRWSTVCRNSVPNQRMLGIFIHA